MARNKDLRKDISTYERLASVDDVREVLPTPPSRLESISPELQHHALLDALERGEAASSLGKRVPLRRCKSQGPLIKSIP